MRTARICDVVDAEMSTADFRKESVPCLYLVGDRVLLLSPERRQTCVPPFESGWHVSEVVSPSTVRIRRASQEKTVNVALIKPDQSDNTTERVPAGEDRGVPAVLGVEREVCGPPPLYFIRHVAHIGSKIRTNHFLSPSLVFFLVRFTSAPCLVITRRLCSFNKEIWSNETPTHDCQRVHDSRAMGVATTSTEV